MKNISRSVAVLLISALVHRDAALAQMPLYMGSDSVDLSTFSRTEPVRPSAQSVTAPPPAEMSGLAQPPAVAAPIAGKARSGGGALIESLSSEPVDFNFKDADITGILRTFALRFNKNIIAGSGVAGKVNLQLRGVPFDEAFTTLLEQMNLVAVQKSANVIEIIKASEMPVLVQVFPLKYRFASELALTVANMLTGKDKTNTIIAVDAASNALIVTSTNDVLYKVKVTLEQLDIESIQIAIKARLIEIQAGNVLNAGISWATSSPFTRGNTKGTVRSFKDQGNVALETDGSIDSSQAPGFFPLGGVIDVSAVLDKQTLHGLLHALQTDSRTKTISEPMILTGNNKSSKIHVGQNLPVRTSLVSQTSTIQSVTYIPEGVDLDVTPIVSPGSNVISFKIKVGVSEFLGFQSDAPITTERVAQTEVSIESGKTVVIGGLMREKMIDVDSGIPFLKSIPLLGWLFKTKRRSNEKTELLIFITPELLVKR